MSDRAEVRILPPLIPLGGMAVGAALHVLSPTSIGPDGLVRPVGLVLIAGSIALVLAAARSLARFETAFDVRKSTTQLVAVGPYRISRNPVYLAAILLCWGIGLSLNALWLALCAIPSASALCLWVIRREESYLQGKFGPEYAAYCQTVRRWL